MSAESWTTKRSRSVAIQALIFFAGMGWRMRSFAYAIGIVTCVAVLGFIANQVYRQHATDGARAALVQELERAAINTLNAPKCAGARQRAKEFVSGPASELAQIERDLRSCGLSLSDVR
jgi:hypothetical protein